MDEDEALTYEEAKQLCQMAFDAGVDYHSTCTQFNCNAVAYDWEHWLKKNERLFRPKPTVEDVLTEFACAGIHIAVDEGMRAGEFNFSIDEEALAEYAAKLRLAEDNSSLYEWERDE